MKDFAKRLYKSRAWKTIREDKYKQASGLCEYCLQKGIYKPGEIVHHIIHVEPSTINDPSVTLSTDNLVLLCRDCHAEAHKTHKARYNVDALGRIIL